MAELENFGGGRARRRARRADHKANKSKRQQLRRDRREQHKENRINNRANKKDARQLKKYNKKMSKYGNDEQPENTDPTNSGTTDTLGNPVNNQDGNSNPNYNSGVSPEEKAEQTAPVAAQYLRDNNIPIESEEGTPEYDVEVNTKMAKHHDGIDSSLIDEETFDRAYILPVEAASSHFEHAEWKQGAKKALAAGLGGVMGSISGYTSAVKAEKPEDRTGFDSALLETEHKGMVMGAETMFGKLMPLIIIGLIIYIIAK